ncbi:MAG: hypothetical protein ACRCSV_02280 [Chlamydiales bacterium]
MSRCNVTCGMALDHELDNDCSLVEVRDRTRFQLPVSIRYQGETLFFDIGLPNIIPNGYNENSPFLFQTVKLGVRF